MIAATMHAATPCLAQAAAVPDLDDQREAGKRDRERGPDTSAHGFVEDEARPERDEDRGDVLDQQSDPDVEAVDREEVGPLHERERNPECDEQGKISEP